MQIPCESIKGFSKLTEQEQAIFRDTYDCHYRIMGTSMREAMTPVSVEDAEEEDGSHFLKVIFNDGDWRHYLPGGRYY